MFFIVWFSLIHITVFSRVEGGELEAEQQGEQDAESGVEAHEIVFGGQSDKELIHTHLDNR